MSFQFARNEGFPTQYEPNETPVTVDVLESGFIAAFLILILTFIVALLNSQLKPTLFRFFRISTLLVIGLLLMLGNFGQEWEVGHISNTRTPYKAGSAAVIKASIGVKIGLRSVNVTLQSQSVPEQLKNEVINYNERFSWGWDQGRFGFGPFAGHLQQEFRAAQYRGLPLPILWVVDYFVIDGEGFRHGRFYRTAGWYSHICLYSAFACWLLALILFRSVVEYGAYCLGVCGVLQLTANLLWLVVRNPNSLVIPFEDATITTKFGSSYWLTFSSGLICLVITVAVIVMSRKFEQLLYEIFEVNPLNCYDEIVYLTKTEELELRSRSLKKSNIIPLVNMNMPSTSRAAEDDGKYVPVYVKRSTSLLRSKPSVIRSYKPPVNVNRSYKPPVNRNDKPSVNRNNKPPVDRSNKPKRLVIP